MPASSFSASIVTFQPEPRLFGRALSSLATAIVEARRRGVVGEARVFVIDNGPPEARSSIEPALAAWPAQAGSLFTTAGPPFTAPFNPGQVESRQVGSATITFSDANNGVFSYSVDGVSGAKSITRQPF